MSGALNALLLSFGLPTAAESALLRACLVEDAAARRGATIDELVAAMTDPAAGRRWMLPLLADRLEREGRLSGGVGTRLRAAALHETGRSATFDRITADMLAMLDGAGVPAMLSRGHALALHGYARSGLRHRHDLDLIVAEGRIAAAGAALARAGLGAWEGTAMWRHASGLRIMLHDRPLPCAATTLGSADPWDGAASSRVEDVAFRTPSPTIILLHVLLLPPCSAGRGLAWVADAAVAIRAFPIDWDRIGAVEGVDAFDVLARLDYLARTIELPIPAGPRERLRQTIGRLDRTARDAALIRARRRGGARAMMREARTWAARVALARWMLRPETRGAFGRPRP